jgi:hypothetical protein
MALAPVSESAALMQIISRAASDASVDIDKMERLFKMHEAIVARDAEKAFNVAMSDVQAKSRRVAADSTNPQTHSDYASYAALDRALRPLYTEAGFSLSFGTGESSAETVLVLCRVSHSAGHSRDFQILMPADGKGAKGGDVMTKTHATGAATQYGMRYLLKMIFNIAIGFDDDGNSASASGMDPSMRADFEAAIEALVDEAGATALWKTIAAACKACGDKVAYKDLKERIGKKGAALKGGEK